LHAENHSPGEWWKKRLMPIMKKKSALGHTGSEASQLHKQVGAPGKSCLRLYGKLPELKCKCRN